MIKKIAIDGLLSFEKFELELRNLNVLIGANGSGKSNLIEVLSLLQALPTGLETTLNRGGGIGAWLRIGSADKAQEGSVRAILDLHIGGEGQEITYEACLRSSGGFYQLIRESISAKPGIVAADGARDTGVSVTNQPPSRESALYRPKIVDPGLTFLYIIGDYFESYRLYVGLGFGPSLEPRRHQPADQQFQFLQENGRNLALVLQNSFISSSADKPLNEEFKRFFGRFQRFSVSIFGNQVLLNMHEEDLREPVPATRWSDGMIRYLCLLAILCHPNPPPLICIDEPELGLHPDVLHHLARLIKSCAEKTQLIITTHSAELVDRFSDEPEAVVVCERDFDGATRMKRLDAESLGKWLEDYSLGELWRSGEIGGNPV